MKPTSKPGIKIASGLGLRNRPTMLETKQTALVTMPTRLTAKTAAQLGWMGCTAAIKRTVSKMAAIRQMNTTTAGGLNRPVVCNLLEGQRQLLRRLQRRRPDPFLPQVPREVRRVAVHRVHLIGS